MATIAARIKSLRTEAGLTQTELGQVLGIVKSTVSLYESGKSTPNDQIKLKICDYFNVPLDYLVGVSDDRRDNSDSEWRYSYSENRLGMIISDYCQKNGISEKTLCSKLGISEELFSKIAVGIHVPSLKILEKLSEITSYDIDFLTGANNSVNSNKEIQIGNSRMIERTNLAYDFHFWSRLEEQCLKRGITSQNAEERLGISVSDFIEISYNRMPTLSELLKLSYALGLSMDYLIGKTDIPILNLSADELELLLNYRDCIDPYKKNIRERAEKLSLESIPKQSSVAGDDGASDNEGK